MSIQTINPTTGEVLETFEPYTERQINEALEQARHAFVQWRATPFAERGQFATVTTALDASKWKSRVGCGHAIAYGAKVPPSLIPPL